jgi:protein gp37
MARDSKIEWTHHTFNPWWGCERVSPACKNCYAEAWAHRLGLDLWRRGAPRKMLSVGYWSQPLTWNKAAAAAGRRDRVFCASMADVFEDRRDLDEPRARLWDLVEATPNLDWLLLTKRPNRVGYLVPWRYKWPRNVWLGTTVENQRWAEKRVPQLLEHPAVVHFLSCEPLLGPVDLGRWLPARGRERAVRWVITGGESGHRARPMNPDWARSLRDQCVAHRVAFHFKQWGNWRPVAGPINGRRVREMNGDSVAPILMVNLGKRVAGRDLDGKKWDAVPTVAAA